MYVIPMIERQHYDALLRLLPVLYSAQTLETFPKHMTDLISGLIRPDSCGYSETNFARRRFETQADPALRSNVPDADGILARLMPQHPMVVHNRNTDQRALKMSDLISQRQFHRLEIYNLVYGPVGVEYLMTGGFKLSRAGDIGTLALGRETTDFSENDRELLNLLRPHLRQAYANAEAMTTFESQLEHREQSLEEELNSAVVVVQDLTIKHASRLAMQWLLTFFRDDPARNDKLPDRLERWVRFWQTSMDGRQSEVKPCTPLTMESDEARLDIRFLKTSRDGEVVLLLQHEFAGDCPAMLQRRLGLGPREAEVLFWISKAKTSREIATILSITRKTVDKHVERIQRKLGTENRTAAAAIAWTAMRDSGRSVTSRL
jgi:DNA-binding CsgD family transcriptional regulator